MHSELRSATDAPLGLAFEIPDLLLAQAVAEARGLRIVVETDHHGECEELEEALALYPVDGDACSCLIWRSAVSVVVQPIPGRAWQFQSLGDALEWLAPDRSKPDNDIANGLWRRHGANVPRLEEGRLDWPSWEP